MVRGKTNTCLYIFMPLQYISPLSIPSSQHSDFHCLHASIALPMLRLLFFAAFVSHFIRSSSTPTPQQLLHHHPSQWAEDTQPICVVTSRTTSRRCDRDCSTASLRRCRASLCARYAPTGCVPDRDWSVATCCGSGSNTATTRSSATTGTRPTTATTTTATTTVARSCDRVFEWSPVAIVSSPEQ
jgi:hypothetical protein